MFYREFRRMKMARCAIALQRPHSLSEAVRPQRAA
jgi:hypothetical protein